MKGDRFQMPDLDYLECQGFQSSTIVDWRTRIIFGRAIKPGLKDVITFHGSNFDEAAQAFRDSVDDYLAVKNESLSGLS
jgi:predicted HicB family RNase H-like nuclease